MIEPLVLYRALFSTLNIALLSLLFCIFWRQYQQLRSQFTLGLILMVLALLFHTVVMHPGFHYMVGADHLMGTYGLLTLAADIFETIATGILLYLSWK